LAKLNKDFKTGNLLEQIFISCAPLHHAASLGSQASASSRINIRLAKMPRKAPLAVILPYLIPVSSPQFTESCNKPNKINYGVIKAGTSALPKCSEK